MVVNPNCIMFAVIIPGLVIRKVGQGSSIYVMFLVNFTFRWFTTISLYSLNGSTGTANLNL